MRGHHRGEADRAGAEHRHGLVRRDPDRVEHHAGAGLHAAGEARQVVQRGVTRDGHDVALGDQRVRSEARLAEERGADRPAAGRVRPRRAVGAGAGERHGDDLLAVGRVAEDALLARAAVVGREQHLVAWLDPGDVLAGRLDRA